MSVSYMNLSALALEVWRASGPRTIARLESTLAFYAASYYGPAERWTADIVEEVGRAAAHARSRVHAWEVQR